MKGHCSTGQSPQWAVVPIEEEEEEEEEEERYLTAIGLTPGGSSTVSPTIYSRCSIFTTQNNKSTMYLVVNCI